MNAKMQVLDVGCGSRPQGDVNCDLFVGRTPHTEQNWIINPKEIPNFVRCDAHFLPFRDHSFYQVYSNHLLEHVTDPSQVLCEMVRVAKRKVTFIVPHRMARTSWLKYHQCKMHRRYFNKSNIQKWLHSLGFNPNIKLRYRYFPHTCIPIIRLPWEIKVDLKI